MTYSSSGTGRGRYQRIGCGRRTDLDPSACFGRRFETADYAFDLALLSNRAILSRSRRPRSWVRASRCPMTGGSGPTIG